LFVNTFFQKIKNAPDFIAGSVFAWDHRTASLLGVTASCDICRSMLY